MALSLFGATLREAASEQQFGPPRQPLGRAKGRDHELQHASHRRTGYNGDRAASSSHRGAVVSDFLRLSRLPDWCTRNG
jgi:hypothetical protein